MAIKAFSGGIQNQPLPEINLDNINDGDILVYSTAQKAFQNTAGSFTTLDQVNALIANINSGGTVDLSNYATTTACLLYTSPSPRDTSSSRMPSSA